MVDTITDRTTYDLSAVAELEESMTQIMPKSWIEDMMFLKANNKCVPTGLAPKRTTKAIQLHYGTKDGDDEWRSASRQKTQVSISGLMRKLGDSNFDSVVNKIMSALNTNKSEFDSTLIEIVSSNTGSHEVMIRLLKHLNYKLDDSSSVTITPIYSIWIHKCFQNNLIKQTEYETICTQMMSVYEEQTKDEKIEWSDSFEYILKNKVNNDWWRPKLKSVVDDSETPIQLCFKIEDYFED